jgi:hypothetical protein
VVNARANMRVLAWVTLIQVFGCIDAAEAPRAATSGAPAPAIHLVASERWILLDEPAPTGTVVHKLHPNAAYEDTSTAPAPPLPEPRAFTLAGPHGPCTIESTQRIYYAHTQQSPARVAIEFPRTGCASQRFVIALDGKIGGAVAHELSCCEDNPADVAAWVEHATGLVVDTDLNSGHGKAAFRRHLLDDDAEIIYAFFTEHHPRELLVRRGERLIARLGQVEAIATLRIDDRALLVIGDDQGVRAVPI